MSVRYVEYHGIAGAQGRGARRRGGAGGGRTPVAYKCADTDISGWRSTHHMAEHTSVCIRAPSDHVLRHPLFLRVQSVARYRVATALPQQLEDAQKPPHFSLPSLARTKEFASIHGCVTRCEKLRRARDRREACAGTGAHSTIDENPAFRTSATRPRRELAWTVRHSGTAGGKCGLPLCPRECPPAGGKRIEL